jgi:hypothetical protein
MRFGFTSLAMVMLLVSCAQGPDKISRENDRLRKSNLKLTRKVEKLEQDIEARVNQVNSLQKQLGRSPKTQNGELLQAASIGFGRYSGALDTTKNGRDNLLRIYLLTLDQRGRFIPVSGKVNLQVAHLTEGQPPKIIAEKTFAGKDLDKTYRSGVTGTHYTLETSLPSESPGSPGLDHVAVRVTFTDAATGSILTHEKSFLVQ